MNDKTLPSKDKVQELLTRAPFHQWLGIEVQSVGQGEIEFTARWREEWVVNLEHRYTHGGVLAALLDLAADWALVSRTGRGVRTIDMRVDYHRAAFPGDLRVVGKVIKSGSRVSVCEARVLDGKDQLLASRRGVYAMPPAKA